MTAFEEAREAAREFESKVLVLLAESQGGPGYLPAFRMSVVESLRRVEEVFLHQDDGDEVDVDDRLMVEAKKTVDSWMELWENRWGSPISKGG